MSLQLSQSIPFGHSAIFYSPFIVVFGGYVESASSTQLIYTNELRIMDTSTQLWYHVNINKETSENSDMPSARNFHSCILQNSQMVIYGGKSNGLHSDVWSLDLSTLRLSDDDGGTGKKRCELSGGWIRLETSWHHTTDEKSVSLNRYGHSAVVWGDQMIVFGGYDNVSGASNDLFVLDLKSLQWRVVKFVKSPPPAARYFHSMVLDGNGNAVVFGGKGPSSVINDCFRIKLQTLNENSVEWELISKTKPLEVSRFGHSSFVEGSKVFVLGGCNGEVDCLDLWSCDCLKKNQNGRRKQITFFPILYNPLEKEQVILLYI